MKQGIFIGQISSKTGVPVKTIRYYEGLGLLEAPKRTHSAYRLYGETDIERLSFIKKAKELGLTLSEIKEILELSEDGLKPTCCFVREVFNKKIKEYEQKIKELSETKEKLEEKLKNWIEPKSAMKEKFIVCPQIEVDKKRKKKS